MKIITTLLDLDPSLIHQLPIANPEEAILIDIETTGFSSTYHQIYLIGFIYMDDHQCVFTQFFSEKESDEYHLLFETEKLLKRFKTVVHYNGQNFDMPFIINRMALYRISNQLIQLNQLDVYLDLKPIGKYLPLNNLKLKTVEAYFGMNRKDRFSGGELIQQYASYLDSPDENLLRDMLLHNQEDLIGLLLTTHGYEMIRYFREIKNTHQLGSYTIFINNQYLIIDIHKKANFEIPIKLPYFHVFINKHALTFSVPITTGELKFFYDDFENYYFLTQEGYAVHKSVGKLVDHKYRKKAKRSNCYSKKRGRFIPYFQDESAENLYRLDYRTKPAYIEITDQFLKETDQLRKYIIQLLGML